MEDGMEVSILAKASRLICHSPPQLDATSTVDASVCLSGVRVCVHLASICCILLHSTA